MKTLLKIFLVGLIALFGIIIFNTMKLKNEKQSQVSTIEIPKDDTAAKHLSEDIQIKTV